MQWWDKLSKLNIICFLSLVYRHPYRFYMDTWNHVCAFHMNWNCLRYLGGLMGRERRVERGLEGMIENILKTIYFIKLHFIVEYNIYWIHTMKIWKWIQNKVQKKKSHLIFFSEEKIFSWYTAQKLIWPTEWKVHWEVSIPLTGDGFMIHFSYLQERKHIYFYYVKARKTVISAIPICHPLDSIAFTLSLPFSMGSHFVICYIMHV